MTIRRFFGKIRMFPRKVKWFIQRGKRGYADCDLWDFDTYLEKVMSKGLRDFADRTQSFPDYRYPTFEDWQTALREIANLIEKFNPDNSMDWDSEITAQDWKDAYMDSEIAQEIVFDWFKSNWSHLWD